jgi:hypothetical protein
MPRKKKTEETEEVESQTTSLIDEAPIGADDPSEEESAEDMKSRSKLTLGNLDHSDLFADFDPDEEDDIEQEFDFDRTSTKLDDPPLVGGSGMRTGMFGRDAASPQGRAISPRLYAQAAQFPTCTQLRVWKWENGVPVGLGAIDAMASEEDLVREFFNAMPKRGEGRCQFKMRPIDINGNELGTEVNCIISEHHAAIQRIKRMQEEDEDDNPRRRRRWEDDEEDFQPQWGRMMDMGEKRAEILERQLEAEREELRRREEQRMQEQVDLATSAAQGVQVLTERMMQDESKRAERAMQMQTEQSQTLITTLTSIFAQQQTMLQAQMEAQRRQDEYRLEQERQRAARERQEADQRRERERLELEERRRRERDEYERKMILEREAIERKLQREQKDMELRMQREREEVQLKMLREKEEREARERWFSEERLRREAQEREDARQREQDRQRQHERMMRELEVQQQKDREHAERMMILSKQELQTKAMGGLGEMIPMATGLLQKVGLEPMEVVQKLFAPEQEAPSMWESTLPKLLGAGADIARVALAGKAPAVSPIQAAPQALPQLPPSDYMQQIDYEAQMARMRQQPEPIGYDPMEPIGAPEVEPQSAMPQDYQPPAEGGVVSFKETKLGMESSPKTAMEIASEAGMTLGEQRDARNALTQLVGTLHAADQDQWEELITSGLMAEPQIFTYIQAVSVRQAIREAGADGTLTENIVKALQASTLVPNDLNYGE